MVKNQEVNLIKQGIRNREFDETVNLVQGIDFATANIFPLLYRSKRDEESHMQNYQKSHIDQFKRQNKNPNNINGLEQTRKYLRKYQLS